MNGTRQQIGFNKHSSLLLKLCKINNIWLNLILKIVFEVYIEFYHDYKNVHYKIVL